MSKIYLEQAKKAQMLAKGLMKRRDEVARVGVDEATIERLELLAAEAERLNDEVEKWRSETNTRVTAANRKLAELKELLMGTKKTVKMHFPQEKWMELGIPDKR